MSNEAPDLRDVAAGLRGGIGLVVRRLRQAQSDGGLTLPERSLLGRLDRGGPATTATLARLEQISPQSMGTTVGGLENRGLVGRQPDPQDGRCARVSITEAGLQALRDKRDAQTQLLAQALANGFTPEEIGHLSAAGPLLERLAQSI
ncbi:MarR family winged helix-turn-helix transcriptional regulator [Nocardia sp. NPDC088792]|uniref:MarR family winged helix-turn-helix transcriptional regulator n=1 Tax=Nocardia sp. NPDC088792 TaxID=3364332 RepID=UPI0037F9F569